MAEERHSDHQYTTNRRSDSSETGQPLSIDIHHALAHNQAMQAAHLKVSPGTRQAAPVLGSPSQGTLGLPSTTVTRVSPIPRYAPGIGLFQGHGLVNILPGSSGIAPHPGLEAFSQMPGILQMQQAAAAAAYSGQYDTTAAAAAAASASQCNISPQDRLAADTLTQLMLKAKAGPAKDSRTEPVHIVTQANVSSSSSNRGPSPHRFTHSPRSGVGLVAQPGVRLTVPGLVEQSSAETSSGASPWRFNTPPTSHTQGKPSSYRRTASPGKPRTVSPATASISKPNTYVIRTSPTPNKPTTFAHVKQAGFGARTTPPPPPSSTSGKPYSSGKPASYAASKPVVYAAAGKPGSYVPSGVFVSRSDSPGKVIVTRGPSPAATVVQNSQSSQGKGPGAAYFFHNSPQSAANNPENHLPSKPVHIVNKVPQTRVTPPPPSGKVILPTKIVTSNGGEGGGRQKRFTPPPPPSSSAVPLPQSVTTLQQGKEDRFTPPPPPPPLPRPSNRAPYQQHPSQRLSASASTSRSQGGVAAPLLYSALATASSSSSSSKPVNGLPPGTKVEEEKENRFTFSSAKLKEDDDDGKDKFATVEQMKRLDNPYNMRLSNLSHFPTGQTQRAGYRSHAVSIQRAKAGCITSPAKSLDLLRQNLQKFINKELDAVVQNYVETYFKPALDNVRVNIGEEGVPDDSINAVCATMLEEAKKMYVVERSVTPGDISDNVSESGSTRSLLENKDIRATKHSLFNIRKRRGSSDSDASGITKKRGRKPKFSAVSGRSTPSKQNKGEAVKREGARWEPDRLTEDITFVMGARANKALGLGNMRGRLYVKHPDLFKYCGDQDDKNWLHEHRHMPATGGKAYLLIEEDIRHLAESDEYRGQPGVVMAGMVSFSVPQWMLDKMKIQMQALRTDQPRSKSKQTGASTMEKTDISALQDPETTDSTTALSSGGTVEDTEASIDKLPFTNFGETSDSSKGLLPCSPTSLAGTVDDDVDEDEDDNLSISPFNLPSAIPSPAPSGGGGEEEDTGPLTAPFEMV